LSIAKRISSAMLGGIIADEATNANVSAQIFCVIFLLHLFPSAIRFRG
jgi:hypothetical protein